MSYRLAQTGKGAICICGCGGTGSILAEGLCRLLVGQPEVNLYLVDHDRVEPHNLHRQAFFEGEVGKFKSQALAERLSRLYGREVAYSVQPYEPGILNRPWGDRRMSSVFLGILVGCVDNAAARRALSKTTLSYGGWLVDAGNGEHSGQVLVGNTDKAETMKGAFDPSRGEVKHLPLPTIQLPALLQPRPEEVRAPDCAEAVAANAQSPVINQAMAMLTLEFVRRLLGGELTWMGAYLDLEAGTLSTVPAEPQTVARIMSVRADSLVARPRGKKQ